MGVIEGRNLNHMRKRPSSERHDSCVTPFRQVERSAKNKNRKRKETRWLSIRRASIIIKPPRITTLPPTIILKQRIITILVSTKRPKNTPSPLMNTASKVISIRPPPTNILTNKTRERFRLDRLALKK